MVSGKDFLRETINRTDRSLVTNQCNLAFEEKIKDQNEPKDELASITRRARALADQIRAARTYDGLRVAMRQNVLEMEQAILGELDEQGVLIKQYLPLLSLPKNPIGAVKYLKNFALKDIFPKVQAAIRYTRRIIEFTFAITELVNEVDQAIEYLENYVRTAQDEARAEQLSAIQRISFALQAKIQNSIAEKICEELKLAGVTANDLQSFYDAINELNLIKTDLSFARSNLRNVLGNNVNQVSQLQTAMSEVSGIPPAIDTTDVDAYIASVERGDDLAYLEANQTIVDIQPPKNIIAPKIIYASNSSVVTGNVNVATTLSIFEGEWENGIEATSFEWYVDSELVANTQQYTPTANAINKSLSAVVIKENFVAITEANTQVIENVDNPFTFVANIDQPDILGIVEVGETITCSQGLWDGTSPLTYEYQWIYAKTGELILGATTNEYTIDDEDKNRTLACIVKGTNILGSNTINSTTTIRVP